jgi:hypothetical protein
MDKRKGLKRLALAVSIPYFGWWAFVAWINWSNYQTYNAKFLEAAARDDWDSAATYSKIYADALDFLQMAFIWGVVVAMMLLVLVGISYWVYRGFKPKAAA